LSDKLKRHLQLRTPILWVETDEAINVIDAVANYSDRPVFRMDLLDGLLTYRNGQWVQVLGSVDPEDPDNFYPIFDFQEALFYFLNEKGVLLIENAHNQVKPLMGFLNHLSDKWFRGFRADDAEKIPASVILLSHEHEIPPEFRRIISHYVHPLPSEEQIQDILQNMITLGEIDPIDSVEMTKLTRASVGMSEFEILHSAANSLVNNTKFDAEYLNAEKLSILAKDGILTMRIPKMTMAEIGGMDNVKHIITRNSWIWRHPDQARELDIEPRRKILLIGVPGTGKSALCEATASDLGLELAKFGVGAMMNKFVGESEANMRRAFAQIKVMAPLCLWIDELGRDFSGGQSSGSVDGGTTDRVHGEMLTGLQDLPNDVFLVCAANRIDDLPPEMLRADRFDQILFVGFPTQSERADIFRIHLNKPIDNYNVDDHYNVHTLAAATDKFTGAEIKSLIKQTKFEISATEHRPPTTKEIVEFSKNFKGRVWTNHRAAIKDMYEKAVINWDWASSEQEEEAKRQYNARNPSKGTSQQQHSPLVGGSNAFTSGL